MLLVLLAVFSWSSGSYTRPHRAILAFAQLVIWSVSKTQHTCFKMQASFINLEWLCDVPHGLITRGWKYALWMCAKR